MLEFLGPGEDQQSVFDGSDSERGQSEEEHGDDLNNRDEVSITTSQKNSTTTRKKTKVSKRHASEKVNYKLAGSSSQKRKLSFENNDAASSKTVKSEHFQRLTPAVQTSVSTFFKELTPIPKDFSQPTFIYQEFAKNSEIDSHDTLWFLTRLFYAVGSPDAFHQLHGACNAARTGGNTSIDQLSDGILYTIQALDRLDTTLFAAGILRRFHLASLVSHRKQKEAFYIDSRPLRAQRVLKYSDSRPSPRVPAKDNGGLGRAETQATTDLMVEAYPNTIQHQGRRSTAGVDYQKKLRLLKDRLRNGRNWYMLQENFGPGILALFPTKGDYGLSNTEFERLPIDSVRLLLKLLIEYRGDFLRTVSDKVSKHVQGILYQNDMSQRYVFESLDGAALKHEPLDSSRLIELCEIDMESSNPKEDSAPQ